MNNRKNTRTSSAILHNEKLLNLLGALLETDVDIRRLLLDDFPDIYNELKSTLSYDGQIDFLILNTDIEELFNAIKHNRYFNNKLNGEHLIRMQEIISEIDIIKKIQEPGSPYNENWYIHRNGIENYIANALIKEGRSIIIKAPIKFGKSWLLKYMAHRLSKINQFCIISLDLSAFDSMEELLPSLADQIHNWLDRNHIIDETKNSILEKIKWGRSNYDLGTTILDNVASIVDRSGGHCLFILDNSDTLQARPGSDIDKFLSAITMQRASASNRGSFSHSNRLLLNSDDAIPPIGYSKKVNYLATVPLSTKEYVSSCDQSNIVEIEIPEYSAAQVESLANMYGVEASRDDIKNLMKEIGGHPYLAVLAMCNARLAGTNISQSVRLAPRILAEYFNALADQIKGRAGLQEAFADLANGHKASSDSYLLRELSNIGVTVYDGFLEHYRLRSPIYAELLMYLGIPDELAEAPSVDGQRVVYYAKLEGSIHSDVHREHLKSAFEKIIQLATEDVTLKIEEVSAGSILIKIRGHEDGLKRLLAQINRFLLKDFNGSVIIEISRNEPRRKHNVKFGTKQPSGSESFDVRTELSQKYRTEADFGAFCLDWFPRVYHNFSTGMDRTTKTNILLSSVPLPEIQAVLSKIRYSDD